MCTYCFFRDQVSINTGFTLSLDIDFYFLISTTIEQLYLPPESADHLTFYKTRSDLPVHQHPKHPIPLWTLYHLEHDGHTHVPFPPSQPSTALPKPVADAGTDLNKRGFIQQRFRGWNKVGFKGDSDQACCNKPCCPINTPRLKFHLRSARATTPLRVIRLWSSKEGCQGSDSIFIDSNNERRDLPLGAEYYFMSLDELI